MSAFFYLSKLCCFCYYLKNIKYVIVLETYVTHDVINSNLMLIVLHLCRFLVQTFLNGQKLQDGHAKTVKFLNG